MLRARRPRRSSTPIRLSKARAQQTTHPLTEEEQSEYRTVVGISMWIMRSCRPGIAYRTSKSQTAVKKPVVQDIIDINKVVKFVTETKNDGLVFRPGVEWPSQPGEPPRFCIGAVSDASHGGEDEYLDGWQVREPFRSQEGKRLTIGNDDLYHKESSCIHVVSCSSKILRRVCSSTSKAETDKRSDVVDEGGLLRAALADAHGKLDERAWESSAADYMKMVWFTDCTSAYDTLQRPVGRGIDKRLGIEVAPLRQFLWRAPGRDVSHPGLLEEKPAEASDVVKWIDTAVMICVPLTKMMSDTYLMKSDCR